MEYQSSASSFLLLLQPFFLLFHVIRDYYGCTFFNEATRGPERRHDDLFLPDFLTYSITA
jgi:hypothetical protein